MMESLSGSLHLSLRIVNRVAEWVCCTVLTLMVLLIVTQVFLRYVVSSPLSWSEEVTLLLLVWFAMLAVAVGVYRHTHMAVGVIWDRLPPPGQYWTNLIAQALVAAFAINIAVNAGLLVAKTGGQILPASGVSRWWLYLAPCIGGALAAINAMGNILLDRFSDETAATASDSTLIH